MSAKEKTMKYGLVGLFLGILLLAHLDLLAENLSYLLLNLGKKYGTASGIGSLVTGIILIILGLFL